MTRRLLKLLAGLLLGLLLWQALEVLTWRRARNPLPLPGGWKKGAYHIHTLFSDGGGDWREVARAAAGAGLDFVVLNDHGRPNLGAQRATAWLHGVLVVGASEFSLHAGHLAVLGARAEAMAYPPEAGEAIADVERDGGASFLAHPCDSRIPWTEPGVPGASGIEVISAYDAARRGFIARLPLFPLQYLISSDYALTALFRYPAREVDLWNRRLRRGPCSGIYALDAHSRLRLPGGGTWRFPSYAAQMRILTVYAQPDGRWGGDAFAVAGSLTRALRGGRFFSCIESLAAGNGFDFRFISDSGRQAAMGERSADSNGALRLATPFPFPIDLRLWRNDRPLATFSGLRRGEITVPVSAPGAYRAEIFISRDRFSRLPWILGNPVYLGPPPPPSPPPPAVEPRRVLGEGPGWFAVEKNRRSRGEVAPWLAPAGTRLDFHLQPDPAARDFWVALAHRGSISLDGTSGVTFEARSDRRRRFWLQLRSGPGDGDTAFQRSFAAGTEWQRVTIPFAAMVRLFGPDRPFPPRSADSLFLLIDNGIAPPGTRGQLEIRGLALY